MDEKSEEEERRVLTLPTVRPTAAPVAIKAAMNTAHQHHTFHWSLGSSVAGNSSRQKRARTTSSPKGSITPKAPTITPTLIWACLLL